MFLRSLFARVTAAGTGASAPSARVGVAIVVAAFAVAARSRTADRRGTIGAAQRALSS